MSELEHPLRDGLSSQAMEPQASPPKASIPDAIVLVRADDADKKPLLYACGKCGSVHSPNIYACGSELAHQTAKAAAKDCYNCKENDVCACGAECPKYWTSCYQCQYKRKLEAAEEVPDDGGPYCALDGNTYYQDLEYARDDDCEWVSPCTVTYPKIDAENILDSLISDMHEDADIYDLNGVEEFMAAVEAFNKAQTTQTWWSDSKRKINVAKAMETGTAKTEGLGAEHDSAGRKALPEKDFQP